MKQIGIHRNLDQAENDKENFSFAGQAKFRDPFVVWSSLSCQRVPYRLPRSTQPIN